jgi:putative N6-adenine-specific DNA methylase
VGRTTHSFFVTCAKGTEGPLRKELVQLKIRGPKGDQGGVSFIGTLSDAFKVSLHSRIGMRVLLELGEATIHDADDLYAFTRGVDWLEFIGGETTIAVSASCRDNPNLRHSGFVALKVKDAVVDSIRDQKGWRPNVDSKSPDLSIFVHLVADSARLYIDMVGEPMHRRGYRVAMVPAPLKESLAAAILSLSGVPLDQPFVDPMTGSGTLAIEHALMARKIAPGLHRAFSFERWVSGDHSRIWQSFKQLAKETQLAQAEAPILVRDISPSALDAARKNAKAAGVEADLRFELGSLAGCKPQGLAGSIIFNPPYGERLSPTDFNQSETELFNDIRTLIEGAKGWSVACLAATPDLPKAIPLRPTISHRLWNGPIETRLLVYQP